MKNGVFLFVCLFLLITGYVALADEDKYVYTFQDLFTILDASNYSSEHKAPEQVTIQIQRDIALEKEIVVPREMKNLTLYLNRHTIDGNNNSFLRLTHEETDKQFHWKPSKDEERLINTSIAFLKYFADQGYENAVECIDWLKSLHPSKK